jgi:hypothetical protein
VLDRGADPLIGLNRPINTSSSVFSVRLFGLTSERWGGSLVTQGHRR